MKLNDLIDALAGEIEMAQADLEQNLADMQALASEEPAMMDALEQYSGLALRMGEAAEMAGFPGLQAVCEHVQENTLLMVALPPGDRQPVVDFLQRWPALAVQYLRHLDDPSCAAGLVDHLREAPSPLAEDTALKIAHMLGSMPAQVNPHLLEQSLRPVLARPEDVALELPADVDMKLMEGFFTEAPEQARHLVQLARHIVAGESNRDELTAAKRVVHTLKGSGAIIGLRGLSALSHHLEDILEHFEREGGVVAPAAADVLLDSAYCLEQMIGHVLGEDDYPQQALNVLQSVLDMANRVDRGESLEIPLSRAQPDAALHAHARSAARATEALHGAAPVTQGALHEEPLGAAPVGASSVNPQNPQNPQNPRNSANAAQSASAASAARSSGATETANTGAAAASSAPAAAMRVSVERVDELFRVSGEVSVHSAAMEARLKLLTQQARDLLAQNLRVQKRLFELETVVDVRSLTLLRARTRPTDNLHGSTPRSDATQLDPLEMDQYSELHSTTHALMEEAADARAMALRLEDEIARTSSVHSRQQQLGRDLQHLVISTRMSEVGVLLPRLQRNVRSSCQATGKQAELELQGAATLIDGDILSRLAEPLLHVLRNAVDHGLESPAERRAGGKPESGLITLSFSRQGQQVVLRCQDDGRGLDHAAIRRRALERGLISAEQTMTVDEIARLILMPGFSTRQTVSELSGRGVGLDVVREWVSAMKGSIRIESKTGAGCSIEMRFAASLSTMQSLIVDVTGRRFALPSVQVEQAVSRGVGSFSWIGDQLSYRLQKRLLPAFKLAQLVGVAETADKPLADYDAVIVRIDEQLQVLAVDGLVDSRELLVKNPGRYARHLRGVAGLSILGDGGIAVNLDLNKIAHTASPGGHATTGQAAAHAPALSAALPALAAKQVLIVDDSLSVRNSLLQLVQDAGFKAATARDGLDAIETLRNFKADLVLTDLEMPNMNGLELTAHLRAQPAWQTLPVLMITSRSQEKHRRMADEAGVDHYFTKPYNDNDLLAHMRQALHTP